MRMAEKKKDEFKLDVVSVRLVQDRPIMSEQAVDTPKGALELLKEYLDDFDREVICILNLMGDGKPINCTFASMGAVNYAIAHPRELLKASILSNAAQIIMVHNHPSGNPEPSKEDLMLTRKMQKITELIEIPLTDHVITGAGSPSYYSMAEHGQIAASGKAGQNLIRMEEEEGRGCR